VVVSLGKRPVVWADIALKYPDALKSLPKQTIFMDWNYGWDLNRFGDHRALVNQGFEIWGAPSIRSAPDNYYLTDWEKHFKNIRDFIPQAKNLGYKGIVMTSWSTSGVYSPVFESASDVIDLYAIRRVYPITGFNILVAAFLQNMDGKVPMQIEKFVAGYCKDNYGFTADQSVLFWNALTKTPFEVNSGKPEGTMLTVNQLRDSAELSRRLLKKLKPLKDKEEFDHYRLMAAIRKQYLEYMCIEVEANAPECREDQLPQLVKRLKALDTASLDKEFTRLNKETLYAAEINTENALRNAKINLLIERLSRNKSQ